MVQEIAERGYPGVSVTLVSLRAGVPGEVFSEHFPTLAHCLCAAIDVVAGRAAVTLSEALARTRGAPWPEVLRRALATLLLLADSDPVWARACLVDSLAAGPPVSGRRAQLLRALSSRASALMPVSDRDPMQRPTCDRAIDRAVREITKHLETTSPGYLIDLLAPLTALLAAPFMAAGELDREVARSLRLAQVLRSTSAPIEGCGWLPPSLRAARIVPVAAVLPAAVRYRHAHRARMCLLFLAARPGSSNREIAAAAGVAYDSQISLMMSGLLADGLLSKRALGPGKRNEWRLTERGKRVVRAITGVACSFDPNRA